jgi:hypothetical protein
MMKRVMAAGDSDVVDVREAQAELRLQHRVRGRLDLA